MTKRVIITGAASGIGEATAKALRDRGAAVVGLDLKPADDVIACNVTDQESVDKAVAAAVQQLGGLDALVNCAGIGLPQSAAERPGPDALRVLDVNLLGTWRTTASALPALRASHGRVVNIASGLAHIAVPFATAYGASKRAVVGYSEQLRAEVGDEITVTTVYPGLHPHPDPRRQPQRRRRPRGDGPGRAARRRGRHASSAPSTASRPATSPRPSAAAAPTPRSASSPKAWSSGRSAARCAPGPSAAPSSQTR